MVIKWIGYMIEHANLDAVFSALADPTRRAILSRLAEEEASVSEIAEPFSMSQPAISKHLKVLEKAGLIEKHIDKQRRLARLKAENLEQAANWLAEFKAFWDTSFDQLDGVLYQLKQQTKDIGDE